MSKVTFKNLNGLGISIAAVINVPENFDESKPYPAIVVSHPGGGVKEQTAGTYAKKTIRTWFRDYRIRRIVSGRKYR